MANQTTLSGNGHQTRTSESLRQSKEALAHFTELAELQMELLEADFQDCLRRLVRPVIMVVAGVTLLLGCTPVLLVGIAQLLVEFAAMPQAAAFLATSIVAALLAGGLTFLAWRKLGLSLSAFQRSREELTRNIQWIRAVLK
ncbi:MAG TPA: phage holin family protein, partial [Nitrospiraceae bacterium]|nr:phage holin family protein [Nitrospiraceae bacterium]